MVLVETLYVHKLVSWQRYRIAYRLDRTMLTTITLAYVSILTILFVLPFNQSLALALACVLLPSLVSGSLFTFWFLRKREARRRMASLARLRKTAMERTEEFRVALQHAYATFDFDGNESLDIDTLRQFLCAVYPKANKPDLNMAITAARQLFSENGTISFEGFETVFESHVVPLLGTPMEALNKSGNGQKKLKRVGTVMPLLSGKPEMAVHPEPEQEAMVHLESLHGTNHAAVGGSDVGIN
jgi:hypothetical protein